MNLQNVSIEQLQAEINRRKKEEGIEGIEVGEFFTQDELCGRCQK